MISKINTCTHNSYPSLWKNNVLSLLLCLAVLLSAVELKWSWECLGDCRGPETHTKHQVLRGMLLLWWHVGPVGYLNILFCKHQSFEMRSESLVLTVISTNINAWWCIWNNETYISLSISYKMYLLVRLCCHFAILAERGNAQKEH